MEQMLGLSNGYLSKQYARKGGLGENILNQILEKCPDISPEWLLTGQGEQYRSPNQRQTSNAPESSSSNIKFENSIQVREPLTFKYNQERAVEMQTIPLYSFEAMASVIETLDDASRFIEDRIYIPNMPASDGAAYVRGDSMTPIVQSGDIVLFKRHRIENILFGQIYLLVLSIDGDTLILIKYVQKSELGEEYIKIVSHNKSHEDKDIHKSSIQAIALVKASIRYHL